MMIGYAGFYLTRNTFPYAMPFIQKEFGYTNLQVGWIITLANFVYGFGKGVNGILSDRCNARYFMSTGLFFSALAVFGMSCSSALLMFAVFWVSYQVFQSMGWPPCAKLLTHWFTKKELGTKWALWNTSQQIGNLSMYALVGYIICVLQNWRYIFIVPALVSLIIAVIVIVYLRDTPKSLGLNPLPEEGELNSEELDKMSFMRLLIDLVFKNPLILYVCLANFFLYFVRMSIVNWAPKFLAEFKGVSTLATVTHPAAKDIAGMLGGIIAGYISDKLFHGERGIVSIVYILFVTVFVFFLWYIPKGTTYIQFLIMLCIGFFLSGPQILIGVAAADYSNKRVAGAATGLTGVFGYFGSAFTGLGAGWILDRYDWNAFFFCVCVACICSSIFLMLAWIKRRQDFVVNKPTE